MFGHDRDATTKQDGLRSSDILRRRSLGALVESDRGLGFIILRYDRRWVHLQGKYIGVMTWVSSPILPCASICLERATPGLEEGMEVAGRER